jgi:hypothetical protein
MLAYQAVQNTKFGYCNAKVNFILTNNCRMERTQEDQRWWEEFANKNPSIRLCMNIDGGTIKIAILISIYCSFN